MAQWLTNEQLGNGSDGNYAPSTGTDAPIDSACTGTISTNSLSATNGSFAAGQIILIHQTQGTGYGQWELNVIASYSTGTITTKYPLTYGYATGAQVLVLKQYRNSLVDTGVTVTVKAWNGTVGGLYGYVCNGASAINGTITASSKGFRGAYRRFVSDNGGEGVTGYVTSNAGASAYNEGGGGEKAENGAGGGGGGANGATATAGNSRGDAYGGGGGTAVGNAALTNLCLGGGGGMGGDGWQGGTNGAGGVGGGGVIIFSRSLALGPSGSIVSGAGNGGDADNSAGQKAAAGGGGAGGSILIKASTANLGTARVSASGGSGGVAYQDGAAGGAGSVGRIHVDYSSSVAGSTTPTLNSTNDRSMADAFQGGMI